MAIIMCVVCGVLGFDVAPAIAGATGTVGGIEPISPQEFGGALGSLLDGVYEGMTPLVDVVAKLGVGVSALLLLLVLAVGTTFIGRAVGGLVAIGLGVFLWYGAPYIVAVIKGIWLYLPIH